MAEAICRHDAAETLEAHSAGSRPAGYVHPLADHAMKVMGIPLEGHTSKSWHELGERRFDAVIIVCDSAACDPWPAWPGDPIRVGWFLPDPAAFIGTEDERRELACRIAERLRVRIERLAQLDWSSDRAELERRLSQLADL